MDTTRQAKKVVRLSVPAKRSLDTRLPTELQGACWIWSGNSETGQQVRQFRKVVRSSAAVASARISIFAESRFHLWVNGTYISRGPAFHHPSRRPVQIHDLSPHWKQGANVIAVVVFDTNLPLQTATPSGRPGLIARIDLTDAATGKVTACPTDASWSVNDITGYSCDVPRRGWALGYIDVLDSAIAPRNWQQPDFDDSHWPPASVISSGNDFPHDWLIAPLPPLRLNWQPVRQMLGLHAVHALPPVILAEDQPFLFGEKLSNEPWTAPDGLTLDADFASETIRVSGLTKHRGAVLVFDLLKEYTGQIIFNCTCPTAGTIDIGWSELMINNRPPVMRKKVSYADRLLAAAGENHWEPLAFSAGRYVVLVLRGFEGSVEIRNLGVRATEPELNWQNTFECSDPILNRIADLCIHCIRVGTQEGLMDCPTREQAPYLGDASFIGRWLGMLTGDWRHWKYLVREGFARQSPDGLLRDAVFSAQRRSILDYNLLAVIGAREYLRLTGDLETIHEIIPACRKVFQWFDDRRNTAGLIDTSNYRLNPSGEWDARYSPSADERDWAAILFIDHPGLGWHNVGEPEIDRRGVNTAINAVYLVAREAMRDLERAIEDAEKPTPPGISQMQTSLMTQMFDAQRKVFVDGALHGAPLPQISQQTNIWCLWAKLCDDATAQSVLDGILREDAPNLARCGPYFYSYLLPQMARLGRHRDALDLIRKLWRPMVDSDATTLWETFSGDDLDSRCHPWSAAPIEFLLCEVLGLGNLLDVSAPATLTPRTDLLPLARGTLMTSRGPASIEWRHREDGKVEISGILPAGISATVLDPCGNILATVRGKWQTIVSAG